MCGRGLPSEESHRFSQKGTARRRMTAESAVFREGASLYDRGEGIGNYVHWYRRADGNRS